MKHAQVVEPQELKVGFSINIISMLLQEVEDSSKGFAASIRTAGRFSPLSSHLH